MGARPVSADPRSLRSRDQIEAALHRLGREGTLDSISALSAAAGVTRATFYNHFDSLEEAAWYAISQSFEHNLARDIEERRSGVAPDVVGIGSLRRNVELLRDENQLVRLAESYDDDSGLPGLAGIVLALMRRFRQNAADSADGPTEAEDTYAAAGLYALMAIGARGTDDPEHVATVAYSLLPQSMLRLNF